MQICAPGVPVSRIGEVCQAVAQKHKLTVVRDFIGHGVGTVFHAAPHVFHTKNTERGTMQVKGMQHLQLQQLVVSVLPPAAMHVCACPGPARHLTITAWSASAKVNMLLDVQ